VAYVVLARWTAKPGEEDAVADAIGRMIAPSRAEPGNLVYQCHRDPENPRLFLLYEAYADEQAYADHGASEHFQEHCVRGGIPYLKSREREFYVTGTADRCQPRNQCVLLIAPLRGYP
jgi:quinol monooxygenase YgiN